MPPMSIPQLYRSLHSYLLKRIPDDCDSRLTNLIYLMMGMFLGGSVQLPKIARKLPLRQQKWSIVKRLSRFLDNPVLIGVMPLYSLKHAQFLHNEVPGITIPESIFKQLEDAGEDAPMTGVAIAQDLLRACAPLVAGAYVIPSFGRYELAAEVVSAIPVTA